MARATIQHRAPRAVRFACRPFPRSLAAMRLFEDTRSREVGAARITCEPAGAGKLVVLISMKFELAQSQHQWERSRWTGPARGSRALRDLTESRCDRFKRDRARRLDHAVVEDFRHPFLFPRLRVPTRQRPSGGKSDAKSRTVKVRGTTGAAGGIRTPAPQVRSLRVYSSMVWRARSVSIHSVAQIRTEQSSIWARGAEGEALRLVAH